MVPRSAHRILLVEDEPLIRLGVADQLREAGYNVFEASSADQAMELLPREQFTLILTDIDMPGTCNGLDLAWAVHRYDPELSVILMSGRSLPRVDEMPRKLGFLAKPYRAETLLHIVDDALA